MPSGHVLRSTVSEVPEEPTVTEATVTLAVEETETTIAMEETPEEEAGGGSIL